MVFDTLCVTFITANIYSLQRDHSLDNVKFPDDSLTVRGTPPWHSAC